MRALVWLLALAGCGSVGDAIGLSEPIRVREGTFLPGALPPSVESGPQVTAFETASNVVTWRQAGKSLGGRASPEAYSVALRLADLGSGSWIVPVGAIDPTQEGERVWHATADFGDRLPLGAHELQVVALDEHGQAGPLASFPLCVSSGGPESLGVCDPSETPPAALFSLTWDANVDLDLVVQAPDGKTIDWKHPTTATSVKGEVPPEALEAPELGALTRDSNANCVIDSVRREDLVWATAPPLAGTWRFYANLFSACGQSSVSFRGTLYGGTPLVETQHVDGHLLALAANGGAQLGLLLLEVSLP